MNALLLLAAAALAAAEPRLLQGRLAGAKPGALEGHVIWIESGASLPPIPHQPDERVVNQIRKQFSPQVTALRAGDRVRFENLDGVFHNVFSLDKRNPFDAGLYKGRRRFAEDMKTPVEDAAAPVQAFPAAGKFPVFCNIHPEMFALVYAFEHGYFAVTDKDGLFSLPAPASGRLEVSVDGPRLREPARQTVDFSSAGPLVITIKPARKAAAPAHTRKNGAAYPSDDALRYE